MNRYIKNKKQPFLFIIILMIIILGSIGCKSKMSDSKPPEFIHNSNLELDFSPYFNLINVDWVTWRKRRVNASGKEIESEGSRK